MTKEDLFLKISLCFHMILDFIRGLMAKPIGFLRVPPLKFVEQIV